MNEFLLPTQDFNLKNNEHVYLLQIALVALGYSIDKAEIAERKYGDTTQKAVMQFQTDFDLFANVNISVETLDKINFELEKKYRICGYVFDDYETPIESIRLDIFRVFYDGTKSSFSSAITLKNGSFICFPDIPKEFLDERNNLKSPICIAIDFYQNDKLLFTSDSLYIEAVESIFSFSSDKFTYDDKTLYQSTWDILNLNKIPVETLIKAYPAEITKIVDFTKINIESLMKIIMSEIVSIPGVSAEIIFGLLFQGIPGNIPTELFSEVEDDKEWDEYKSELKFLIESGLALLKEDSLKESLIYAYRSHFIGIETIEKNGGFDKIVSNIIANKENVALKYPILESNETLENIIKNSKAILPEASIKEIALLFIDYIEDFNGFITTLNSDENIKKYGQNNVNILTIHFQISRVVRNFIPMINVVYFENKENIEKYGIRYIGTITKAAWKDNVDNTGYPSDMPGENSDEKAANYVEFLFDNTQRLYPDIVSVSDLETKSFTRALEVRTVLLENPSFKLLENRVEDLNLSDEKLVAEMKSIQNVYRLSPNPIVADTLLNNGIKNSQQIYYMGLRQFEDEFGKNMSQKEMLDVYNLAAARASNAIVAHSHIRRSFDPVDIPSIRDYDYSKIINGLKQEFPDIEKLFGTTTYCECDYDNSVYSAAAYLGDLLTFLEERQASSTNRNSVKKYLDQRRPDIGKIYLNAKNTNTILPYIDLVCEVLEVETIRTVYPNYTRDEDECQSTWTTEELLAAPEHILSSNGETAYDILQNTIYPLFAPLNLWQTEITEYLDFLGVKYYELIDSFHKDTSLVRIKSEMEYFGFTFMEQNVLLLTLAQDDRNKVWHTEIKTTGTTYMPVLDFVADTEIEIRQAKDLVKATWLRLTSVDLFSKCTYEDNKISGNKDSYDRAHRFLRFLKKTDWKIWELDLLLRSKYITNFVNIATDNFNGDSIKKLTKFSKQQKKLNLSVESLQVFYEDMNYTGYYDNAVLKKSLYENLFLNKIISNPLNEELENYIKSSYVPTNQIQPDTERLIAAILTITENDYNLLKAAWITNPDYKYSLQYLSYLYRHVILAQKLKISIADIIRIRKMLNKNIYDLFTFEEVEQIINYTAIINRSDFSFAELEYLTKYLFTNPDDTSISDEAKKIAVSNEKLNEYAVELQELITSIDFLSLPTDEDIDGSDGKFYAKDEYRNKLINWLLKLERFNNLENIDELIKIIERRSEKTKEEIKVFVDEHLPEFMGIKLSVDLIPETEDIDTKDKLIERYKGVVWYINETEFAIIVRDYISNIFDLNGDITDLYLSYPIQPDDSMNWIMAIGFFYSDTETMSLVLGIIHKVTLSIKKYNISTPDYFKILLDIQDKIKFNWNNFSFANFNTRVQFKKNGFYAVGEEVLELKNFVDLKLMMEFQSNFGVTSENKSLFNIIDESTSVNGFIDQLSNLTKWNKDELTYLRTRLSLNLSSFYIPDTYNTLSYLFATSELTGVLMQVLYRWTSISTNEKTKSTQIKDAAKAKYENNDWLGKLAEIQSPIRKIKSESLSAFLLAYSMRLSTPIWTDKEDLYAYFLLDTEMSSCMKISRIVQATSSVQLFVQRCYLNLEPYFVVGNERIIIDEERDEFWKQWSWMKKYRLWEANRKIFLYPENWIEPDLRDDKTKFFKEIEDELGQNEINKESVEIAYENYLQKLDSISNLYVCAMYREFIDYNDGYESTSGMENAAGKIDILHVILRTKSTAYKYYYRTYDNINGLWSDFEEIDIDIESDVVMPVVYNRRLHLFWLSVVQKGLNQSSNNNARNPYDYTEIELCWSVRKNNKWSGVNHSHKKHYQKSHKNISEFSLAGYYDKSENELVISIYTFYYLNPSEDSQTFLFGKYYFNGDAYRSVSVCHATSGVYLSATDYYRITEKYNPGNPDTLTYRESDHLEYTLYPRYGLFFSSRLNMWKKTGSRLGVYFNVYRDNSSFSSVIDSRNRKLLTYNKNANLVMSVFNDYVDMTNPWYGMFVSLYFMPFFYQDSARSFIVRTNLDSKTYEFEPIYHPYTKLFIKELNRIGVNGVLNRNIQLYPKRFSPKNRYSFYSEYAPTNGVKNLAGYEEDIVDFNLSGAYSAYNWELFFHIPFYIADKLSQNQKFEEAMNWYHYIFDPTTKTSGATPQKYWITKPLYQISTDESKEQQIRNVLENVEENRKMVNAWLNNPYNPHLVARMRPVAYQRAIVKKYLDNLIAWADQLFRQDSIESNNEAALLYILAYELLGKRPVMLPDLEPDITHNNNYNNMDIADSYSNMLAPFDNSMAYSYTPNKNLQVIAKSSVVESYFVANYSTSRIQVVGTHEEATPVAKLLLNKQKEARLPTATGLAGPASTDKLGVNASTVDAGNQSVEMPHAQNPAAEKMPRIDTENFCVPANEEMLKYWDIVEDRLFKLRNCMNIEGIVRELPLFEPPIDPAMLVKAAAAGLSIGDALNDINTPQPYYRFRTILQKAVEFTNDVKQLGEKLLSILEKKDAESLSILQGTQNVNFQQSIKQIRNLQINEAKENIESLNRSIAIAQARQDYYSSREYMNSWEKAAFDLSATSMGITSTIAIGKTVAGAMVLIPELSAGGAGALGSPFLSSLITGGSKLSASMSYINDGLSLIAGALDKQASLLSIQAGYKRREEDWNFQAEMARREIEQLDVQVLAAEIRQMVAEKELENLEMQIEQSKSVLEYYKTKYTNEALYNWMITKVSNLYFNAYKLAYDMSKKAENCYRHELGIYETTNFIQFGYWDSLKKGLLSGDQLLVDLHKLESAYFDKNKRTLELTKHISLAQIYPDKLITLLAGEENSVDIDIPEVLFDMDYPGHYMRRIKSVSITIPNVSGPFTNVSCMLTLLSARIRKNTLLNNDEYAEDSQGQDNRFVYQTGGKEYICTSNAQNDSGMFELNFGDERYLPFENAGVISKWKLSLPAGVNQFNLSSISDVIIHINYTSLYDGNLEEEAKDYLIDNLPREGALVFSPKIDFSDEWYKMTDENPNMKFIINKENLPFYMRGYSDIKTDKISIILSSKENIETISVLFSADESLKMNLEQYSKNGDIFLYKGLLEKKSLQTIAEWPLGFTGIKPSQIDEIIIGFSLKG